MIDRIKIGSFLRELRKEKNLSQEELAERFGVSSRSISRWENGNTMPELGMLVDLADFYQVDIKEIVNGEREIRNMKDETNESLRKAAEYSKAEKDLFVKRQHILIFISLAVLAVCTLLGAFLLPQLPETHILRSDKIWMGIGITGLVGLWSLVIYGRIKEKTSNSKNGQ